MGISNRKYTNDFEYEGHVFDSNAYDSKFNCIAIENFSERLAYHYNANIRKQMNDSVRTLFYDLAIEDFSRMGFLKGIILKMATLDMSSHSDEDYLLKYDRLAACFVKVWMLNTHAFAKYSTENSHLYMTPCADDILDTRLLNAFVKKCVPLIEGLTNLFTDNLEVQLIN